MLQQHCTEGLRCLQLAEICWSCPYASLGACVSFCGFVAGGVRLAAQTDTGKFARARRKQSREDNGEVGYFTRALLLCPGRQPALSPLPCYGRGVAVAAEASVKSTRKRGEKMLAFSCWDALIQLHQRRGCLHPAELLWASTVLWWCLGTSSCPCSLGRSTRKPVSACLAREVFEQAGGGGSALLSLWTSQAQHWPPSLLLKKKGSKELRNMGLSSLGDAGPFWLAGGLVIAGPGPPRILVSLCRAAEDLLIKSQRKGLLELGISWHKVCIATALKHKR